MTWVGGTPEEIQAREREAIRRNAESDRPTLYYAPPASRGTITSNAVDWSPFDAADRIVEHGFEDTEDRIMLWPFKPDVNDGVQGAVLVEVVLDCSVAEYAEYEERVSSPAAGEHLEMPRPFFVPVDVVNAHTVSRRRIIPELEPEE